MPRRQFLADFDKAQSEHLPPGIANLRAGDDDGQIEFSFLGNPTPLADGPVSITVGVADLGDYPKSHEYYIFGGEDAPPDISKALGSVRGINKKSVSEMLEVVSRMLCQVQPDRDGDSQMLDNDGEDYYAEESGEDADVYDSDHEIFDVDTPAHNPAFLTTQVRSAPDRRFRERIRQDLRTVKAAGFKAGHLGHLLAGNSSYVTVSIRIAKLGISEEAMQAWQIEPNEYLTLLIQYPNGYKTSEELQGFESLRLAPNLAMRVVVGKRPKPSLKEAMEAFTNVRKTETSSAHAEDLPTADDQNDEGSSIRDSFISKPLNALLQERLVPILRYRSMGLGWDGAERWYEELQATAGPASRGRAVPDQFYRPEVVSDALPEIVRSDHYAAVGVVYFSFPLLAMEFTLRHFVRCTEFCLVCHHKLCSDVEAIKPYVCDNALCLYQYMAIGLGPSIEHEMIAQPYVVDLLVSFCYNSAAVYKLKDFPDGLSLMVPPVDINTHSPTGSDYRFERYGRNTVKPAQPQTRSELPNFQVGFDQNTRELIFSDRAAGCPVRRGDWILLTSPSLEGQDLHCRVSDTTYFPTISIDPPVVIAQQQHNSSESPDGNVQTPAVTPSTTRSPSPTQLSDKWAPASFQVYAQEFNQLDSSSKCVAICRLLDTLPPVTEMRQYLLRRQPADLQSWKGRISSSALSLLRWIIASNRSCIMQVDGNEPVARDGMSSASAASGISAVCGKTQERCYGMRGYMQFRFAMGAPDKEQRFVTEVRKTAARLSLNHQTIFAWHGSPLHNWHMIIREGLHYKNADHGRAYGDGVYHAKDAATSTGYSGMKGSYDGVTTRRSWPSSILKISSALALNEIVNAPQEFQSDNPFYVVKQLDWIQTRYLFVQVTSKSDDIKIGPEVMPRFAHPQDPSRTPLGMDRGSVIVIPASAIKFGKRPAASTPPGTPSLLKKFKSSFGKQKHTGAVDDPVVIDEDDTNSVATDVEDVDLLKDEPEDHTIPAAPLPKGHALSEQGRKPPATDFVPGSLNFAKLPIMPLPTYATPAATKRLMQELRALQKIQESTPAAELGWYIDVDKIENAYQWIVELHSFHTIELNGQKLPLAEDMKKKNVRSIVLEIRFNKDFPFSPPYIRVIRPNFVPFTKGGGGHIVIGGAMCMELLTNTGWRSVLSMETVLTSVRANIASEPFARLAPGPGHDYGAGEGAEGYIRACASHGWTVPPGFKEMAYSGLKQ